MGPRGGIPLAWALALMLFEASLGFHTNLMRRPLSRAAPPPWMVNLPSGLEEPRGGGLGGMLRQSVIVMAKKKKGGPGGPAAQALDALEKLEALEALEAGLDDEDRAPEPVDDKKKKKKKKEKKGEMNDSEDEEGSGETTVGALSDEPPAQANIGKKSKKNKVKGPAAAALAALEELEEAEAISQDVEAVGVGADSNKKKKKDKKKKDKKGPAAAALASLEAAEAAGVQLEEPVPVANSEVDAEVAELEAKLAALRAKQQVEQEEAEAPILARDGEEEDMADEEEDTEAALSLEERVRKDRPAPRVQISESSQPGYVSLRLNKISCVFRDQEVLKDASWEVKTGDRIGLVGMNGCGKTTQMKILAGEVEATSGDIVKSSQSLRTAFLRQEFTDDLVPSRTLKEELLSVFVEENDILRRLDEAEKALAEAGSDSDRMQEVLDDMATLQADAERLEAYNLESKVDKVIDTMGFLPEEADALVASFSGGWKMRIGLGKILLQDPNILFLDEPTNHLDMDSVEWLEEFLVQQNIPMVIVSHDREFLDRVCTKIVETENGVTTSYDGNYSRYLKLKKARLDAWESAYATQQKKIKEDRAWINQNKNKPAASSQVKQRQAKLDKLLKGEGSDELVKRPPRDTRKFRFRFPPPPRTGVDEVAEIDVFTHGYDGRALFDDVDLVVESDDRIAFIGPNGAGKSTLLRCLVGKETPQTGTCRVGDRVVVNYFEQNQADALDFEDSVIGVVQKASTTESYEELRALLGQFLFKGDDVNKKIKNLSGGEKARVALCTMMLTPANLLVLDEPTNHLDISSKEVLEEALQHYEGAMLLISHDRYFISQVATTICAVEDKKLALYSGDYRYYMENRPEVAEKVESRFVTGDARRLGNAKVFEPVPEETKRKKNFGGGGGPSGRKEKGVKNAKRMN